VKLKTIAIGVGMAFCTAMVATGSRAQDDHVCQQKGGGYGGVTCAPTNSPAPKATAPKPAPSVSLTIEPAQLAAPKPAPSASIASDRAIPASPDPAKPAPKTAATVAARGVTDTTPNRSVTRQRGVRRSVVRGTGRDKEYAQAFYGYRSPSRVEHGNFQGYAYDRQRMDPWHGFNGYGPGNGY